MSFGPGDRVRILPGVLGGEEGEVVESFPDVECIAIDLDHRSGTFLTRLDRVELVKRAPQGLGGKQVREWIKGDRAAL